MKKILSFSLFLMIGLVLSQVLPGVLGNNYESLEVITGALLYVALSFIMINVGREFVLDKTKWKSYVKDYFVAMATAALPWIFVAFYFIFIILPVEYNTDWEAWKESLLLSRFAAPTSAGILFTMLAAIGLRSSWIYKKIQVLAIFDDLDTILLMIPLQIIMIGMKWQMGVILLVVTLLLWLGWKHMSKYNLKQDWKHILFYSIIVVAITISIDHYTKLLFGPEGAIHIEVLLPAFVLGMMMKSIHIDSKIERGVSTGISLIFMLLVGLSMPHFIGSTIMTEASMESGSIMGEQPMLSWGNIAMHVVFVTILSNIGKMVPLLFYRDRLIEERLALSIGMFTRGEVGAGIIFIALGYNIGGPALIISVLTMVLNLILTGIFVVWVKKLSLRASKKLETAKAV
ncbi:MAG: sodium:proton antiporter [Bacteroidales bacterium]|nr:sodium:proton antiporter [Bacteroidales bacterium]